MEIVKPPAIKLIGRSDFIDLPSLKLKNIAAKVDSGAYGCALHCHQIERLPNGKLFFIPLDPTHPDYKSEGITTSKFSEKMIKNSFGVSEKRFVIHLDIVLFGLKHKVEFSLTDRGNLKFPVLLGRQLLRGHYVVDVSKTNLSYRNKRSKKP